MMIYTDVAHSLNYVWAFWRRAKERHSQNLSQSFVCTRVCVRVCGIAVGFPSDVPFDLWPHTWGQALTNEMVQFCPELQTFHNNLLSSSAPLLISVIPLPFTPLSMSPPQHREQRKFSLHTNMFYWISCGNLIAHILQMKNTRTG